MKLRTTVPVASLLAATACLACMEHLIAAEQHVADMTVVSSDQASTFKALAVNKAMVIDFPNEVTDVLVSNPKIVNAVLRTKQRAYIIGLAAGQSNVFFFDDKGRQIGGLDIYVTPSTPPRVGSPSEVHNIVMIYRGPNGSNVALNCSQTACVSAAEALPELPPGYTNVSNNSIK